MKTFGQSGVHLLIPFHKMGDSEHLNVAVNVDIGIR